MTTFYIILVAMLLMLAIFDLFVGVSNDAVNFLSSAVGIFGGVSLTSIFYFILIKGLKNMSFVGPEYKQFLSANEGLLLIGMFAGFFVISHILHAVGVNVLKVIIGFGTFSLALAFAGNDLVNFVGVPLTSLSSVRHLIADGGNTGDYERFYCVDKSRSKETGGTGLGLAIVKHIAEVHKATIDLKSIVGSGTEIKVEF